MTVSVTYEPYLSGVSIDQYLSAWRTGFGTTDSYSGGGFNDGASSGSQFATRGGNGTNYALIAGSDSQNGLHYYREPLLPEDSNANLYFHGALDSIDLGHTLARDGSGHYSTGYLKVGFAGLGLSASEGAGVAGNTVHGLIHGLMRGDTNALEGVLDTLLADYGVSTDNTFAAIDAALAHGPVLANPAPALGVQALPEDLALVA